MSTRGMRSILKVKPTALQHLRNKISAGLYDKEQYPFAYDVFSLNPPIIPAPGALSDLKYSETKGKVVLPTDSLVKSYLKRKGGDASQAYYSRPEQRIGLGDVDPFLAQIHYKGSVADAYYFAQRQYQFMRQNYDSKLSEEECVKAVEKILEEEEKEERIRSRKVAKTVQTDMAKKHAKAGLEKEGDERDTSDQSDPIQKEPNELAPYSGMKADGTVPSILYGNTDALMQMARWGDRLSQVPYSRWTIGAATALDHWIASNILGLTESKWQEVLSKKDRSKSIAKDIITVRHALFPETLQGHDSNITLEEESEVVDEDSRLKEEAEKSIDDLLASLGGDDNNDDFWKKLEDGEVAAAESDKGDGEELPPFLDEETLTKLRKELKNWQARNVEIPYAEWDEQEKKVFNSWLVKYTNLVKNDTIRDNEHDEIDLEETRNAIFQETYFSEDQDELMWSALSEDVEAELLLQELLSSRNKLLSDGVLTRQECEEWDAFTKLPFQEQIKQLRGISSLKPLQDENATDSQLHDFASKHIENLCDDVTVDELVPDVNGAITAKDLFDVPEDEHRFKFRTTKMKATEDRGKREYDDKVYRDMTTFHASVANHEESLFEEGELGLERSSKTRERPKSSE